MHFHTNKYLCNAWKTAQSVGRWHLVIFSPQNTSKLIANCHQVELQVVIFSWTTNSLQRIIKTITMSLSWMRDNCNFQSFLIINKLPFCPFAWYKQYENLSKDYKVDTISTCAFYTKFDKFQDWATHLSSFKYI